MKGKIKMIFIIRNTKDNEKYKKSFNSASDCRVWIENHLDLSKIWIYDTKEFCEKLEQEKLSAI